MHYSGGYSQAQTQEGDAAAPAAPKADSAANANGPKPYSKVITDKAHSQRGLFTVHKVDDKWYLRYPIQSSPGNDGDHPLQQDSGRRLYLCRGNGERANHSVGKRPDHKVFLRSVTTISMADSTTDIYKAVTSSNLNPISAAFDIKAIGKDSNSVVIDVTDFLKG